MFEPLTAAPARDLGTWTHKCPKLLSPFPVGDVSHTLVAPLWNISECPHLSWTQSPASTAVLGGAWGTCLAYRPCS